MYNIGADSVEKEIDLEFCPNILKIIPGKQVNMRAIVADSSHVQLWDIENGKSVNIGKEPFGITDVAFQPLNDYCTFSSGKSWSFYDLNEQRALCTIEAEHELHSIEFHPDGLLMATGHQDRTMSIWDIRTQKVFTTIRNDDIQGTLLNQICFSNKGYQFAAAWKDSNVIKLYDMRKNFAATDIIFPRDDSTACVNNISFDEYGNFLFASQRDKIRLYAGKQWQNHQAEVSVDSPVGTCKFSRSNF